VSAFEVVVWVVAGIGAVCTVIRVIELHREWKEDHR
jgi:hypothetical protein